MRRLLSPLPLLLLAVPGWADTLVLANGREIRGKAVEQGETVRVELQRGAVAFPKAEVARVERGPTPWDVYADKAAALASSDVAGHRALAIWCLREGLAQEALKEREAAGDMAPQKPEGERKEAKAAEPEPLEEGRPVEGLFGPMEVEEGRRARRSPPYRGGTCGAGLYPVHPGSIWFFPWGTVTGPPRGIHSGTWADGCAPHPCGQVRIGIRLGD